MTVASDGSKLFYVIL